MPDMPPATDPDAPPDLSLCAGRQGAFARGPVPRDYRFEPNPDRRGEFVPRTRLTVTSGRNLDPRRFVDIFGRSLTRTQARAIPA